MIHNNRLEIKIGLPRIFLLAGLPFFCYGIFGIISIISTIVKGPSAISATALMFKILPAILICLFCVITGSGIMFGHRGRIIDGDNRQVTSWWGFRAGWLLVPFKKSVYSFDDFQSVTVCKEVHTGTSGSSGSPTCYPVRIESAGDSVTVEEPRDYHKSRQLAEEVAKLMGLPMQDSTSGEVVVREAEQLDESLRDQFQRTGERLDVPVQPDGCRVSYRLEGDALVLDLPPPGMGPALFWGVSLIVVIVVVVWDFFSSPPPMNYLAVCFILIPLGIVLILIYSGAKGKDRITVSRRSLIVEVGKNLLLSPSRMLGGKTSEIPSDELEELAMQNDQHIMARSDRVTLTFGSGLSKDELAWMYELLKYVLVTK